MEIKFDLKDDFTEEELWDFNDGRGLVPAHQHPKGNGWVENTAHVDDTCFVGPTAQVFGNARVTGNVIINDFARVYGDALVFGNAMIYGDAQVCDNAQIFGHAKVNDRAKVYGNARVMDYAHLHEDCQVYENAIVRNFVEIFDHAIVRGNGDVYDSIKLYRNVVVTKKPIVAIGFESDAVITDHHICLGCVVIPPYYVNRVGKRVITLMGYGDDIAEKWITALNCIIDIYGCTDRQEDIDATSDRQIVFDLITERHARSDIDPKYQRN